MSAAEQEVLCALLERGETTTVDLHKALLPKRQWTHSTVATFLRRLEAKGLVERVKAEGERAFRFRPTRLAGKSRRTALKNILDRLFGGDPFPLVSSLLEETNLKGNDLDELRRLIDEHATKGRKQA